jgi:hypothetical protein
MCNLSNEALYSTLGGTPPIPSFVQGFTPVPPVVDYTCLPDRE